MHFLFQNFEVFLIVYAAVVLDMVLGVLQATRARTFDWKFLPEFLNTCIKYTVYMLFGNVVDYFAAVTGIELTDAGLFSVAFVLLAVEAASMKNSIQSLKLNQK